MTSWVNPNEGEDAGVGPNRAAEVLGAARSVCIVCHENPDADTLGGSLALARSLDRRGIATEVLCGTGSPNTMAFLPDLGRVRASTSMSEPGAIALVDCASIDRAGSNLADWIRATRAPVINIDHHVSNARYGDVVCVDVSAAATSEVVARVIDALGVVPDRESATLLLAGVLHDTGGLRAAETSATTIRLAAELMDAGADIGEVATNLFARRPLRAIRLWGRVAGELEAVIDERVVIGRVTERMLTDCGAELLDAEDLPDLLATVGAEVTLLLREAGAATRASIRTSGSVDAAAIAREFGGGGHLRAAGCTIPLDIEAARMRLLDSCRRHLSRIANS